MQVEIKIDHSRAEPKVIILTASVTEEIHSLMQKLSEENPRIITGSRNGKIEVLEQNDLYRIYAGNGKVYAVTDGEAYVLRLRLYEAENR